MSASDNLVGPLKVGPTGSGCETNGNVNQYLFDWYGYEVQTDPDLSYSAPHVCNNGVGPVCTVLKHGGSNASAVKKAIQEGYHEDGAQALVKAALMVACPKHSDYDARFKSYKTSFDGRVYKYASALNHDIHFEGHVLSDNLPVASGHQSGEIAVGMFMKQVCVRITENPSDLQSNLRDGDLSTTILAQIAANKKSSSGALKVFARDAVKVGCPGYLNDFDASWDAS
jgi:hypothetical protein